VVTLFPSKPHEIPPIGTRQAEQSAAHKKLHCPSKTLKEPVIFNSIDPSFLYVLC